MDISNELSNLATLAKNYDIELAALQAIIAVESGGVIYAKGVGSNLPVIRYEGHYFDRLCSAAIRNKAREAGISSPTVGGIKNPVSQKNRYALLEKAKQYDEKVAYESCSYGVGQVMGSNWKNLGYSNVYDFVKSVNSGLVGQVEVMLKFIKFNKLDINLRNLDWSGFARGYNGVGYRKNKYDTKLAEAYKRYGGTTKTSSKASGFLRIGSKGAGVKEIQALLKLGGYSLNIDGDFGNSTRDAVIDFQKKNRVQPYDGIVGTKTQEALSKLRSIAPEAPGKEAITQITEVKQGIIAAVGIPTILASTKEELISLTTQLSPLKHFDKVIEYANISIGCITVVSVITGLIYAYKGWTDSKKSFTGTK